MTVERDKTLDLKWAPSVTTAGFYREEHQITVSPAAGAHILIDLALPTGTSLLTIIIEKKESDCEAR